MKITNKRLTKALALKIILALVLLVVAILPFVSATPTLLAEFDYNNNVISTISPYYVNGTAFGTITYPTSDSLNATKGAVYFPPGASRDTLLTTGNYSVCGWINTNNAGTDVGILEANNMYSIRLGISCNGVSGNGGYLTACVAKAGTEVFLKGNQINTGTWQQFCLVRNQGKNITFYSNGAYFNSTGDLSGEPNDAGLNVSIGAIYAGNNRLNGLIDGIRIYNGSLNDANVLTLYTGGRNYNGGITTSASITLVSPTNGIYSTLTTQNFSSYYSVTGASLINTTYYITKPNGLVTTTYINTGTSNSSSVNLTSLVDGSYSWLVGLSYNDSVGILYNANSSINTFTIDTTYPVIAISAPASIINYSALGGLINLNTTITDTNLASCWYSYNNINTSISCSSGILNVTNVNVTTTKTLIVYANDSAGNLASSVINWAYNLFQNSNVYNTPVSSLSYQNYILNFTYDTSKYSSLSGYLIYNGTSIPAITSTDGTNYYLTASQIVPATSTTQIKNLYWNILLSGSSSLNINTTSQQQTINPIGIDACGTNTLKILNYTLLDEDTNTPAWFNATSNSAVVSVDVRISNPANYSNYVEYNLTQSGANAQNILICVPSGTLTGASYRLDAVAQYYATNYITRFNYLQNYNLSSSSVIIQRPLYFLGTTSSQEFKITYQDNTFAPVSGVVIDIAKYYTGLGGTYLSVEQALTDNYGNTIGHFVLGSNLYNINVYQQGVLIANFPNIVPTCSNVAIGDCVINLNAVISSNTFDWDTFYNLNYAYNFNPSARTLILTWNLNNIASPSTILLNVSQFDALGNNTICSMNVQGTSGLYTCNIPSGLGNQTIQADLYKDGTYVSSQFFYFGNGEGAAFGYTGIFLALILVITLALMMITSSIGVIVGAVIGLIVSGLLALISLGSNNPTSTGLGLGAATIWIIIAAVVIIYKINEGGKG